MRSDAHVVKSLHLVRCVGGIVPAVRAAHEECYFGVPGLVLVELPIDARTTRPSWGSGTALHGLGRLLREHCMASSWAVGRVVVGSWGRRRRRGWRSGLQPLVVVEQGADFSTIRVKSG
jgi:hypothetical protein